MAHGWRGIAQNILRNIINLLENGSVKKWTASQQRAGIAVMIGFFASSAVWLIIIGDLTNLVNPVPACDKAECIQSVWQGRWAMWTLLVSAATLVAVIFGFWQSDKVRKEEFRGYLRASMKEIEVRKNNYIINISCINYGKTPIHNIKTVVTCGFRQVEENDYLFTQRNNFSRDNLHPEHDGRLVPRVILEMDEKSFNRITKEHVLCSLVGYTEYVDIFERTHRERIAWILQKTEYADGVCRFEPIDD